MIFFQSVFFTEPDTDSLLVETLGYKIQNAVMPLLVSPEGCSCQSRMCFPFFPILYMILVNFT